MSEEQVVAQYIDGLKPSIQEQVIRHNMLSLNEVHKLALKTERSLRCAQPSKKTKYAIERQPVISVKERQSNGAAK